MPQAMAPTGPPTGTDLPEDRHAAPLAANVPGVMIHAHALGPLYDLYAGRIADYRADLSPGDWDGAYIATSK